MTPLKSFTISVGTTAVFNLNVVAPDSDTALTIAKRTWSESGTAAWNECPPAPPLFQVEDEHDICPDALKTYDVSFYVTDRLSTMVEATNEDEARRIATALRDKNGTYEGSFDVDHSDTSDMDVEEVCQ